MKNHSVMVNWKASSTWRFFLYSLLGLLVIVIFVTSAYLWFLNRRGRDNINNNLLQIEEIYVPFLVSSLWVTDYETLQNQIEGIVKFSYIDEVDILDEEGNLFSTGKITDGSDESYDIVSYDLVYAYKDEARKIGTMSIYINKEQMRAAILVSAAGLLIIQLILILLLAGIIAGAFYLVIGRHLLQFAQFIKDDDPGKNSKCFVLQRTFSRKDELQIMVEHFSSMRQRIREHIARIQQLSYYDQLTGLYNRRFFEEELKRLDTERNLPLSILMIDVNGLKLTNDAFGHVAGDKLLKKVAEVLKQESRADDIIARIGGDEFVVLLPKTDKKHATSLENRLGTAFKGEIIENIPVSVSCGGATKRHEQEKIGNIFKKAEDNMYNQKSYKKDSQRKNSIQIIMNTLFQKWPGEREHARKVSELSAAVGSAMGLTNVEVDELKIAGEYHDIGKVAINSDILNKKGKLTDSEWKEIKRHPELSYNILSTVNEFGPIAEIVLSHHERWDGKGYPGGLKGEEIPLQSRIIMIVDDYDAMTDVRPYRKAFSKEEAIAELKKGAGSQFDPKIVEVFIKKVLSV